MEIPSHFTWGINFQAGWPEKSNSGIYNKLRTKFESSYRPWLMFSSAQSLSRVQLFVTPWTAAYQASLSITNSRSLLKLMSTESVMPSNHLILCCSLLLPSLIISSIRVFSDESLLCIRWPKYWGFSFRISASNEYSLHTFYSQKYWAHDKLYYLSMVTH